MEPSCEPNSSSYEITERDKLPDLFKDTHPKYQLLRAVLHIRDTLRQEYPALGIEPDAMAGSAELGQHSLAEILAEVERASAIGLTQLDGRVAEGLYHKTHLLLSQLAEENQNVVRELYYDRIKSSAFSEKGKDVISLAQAEIFSRLAPIMADLCTAALPSNPLTRDESILFSRAVLEHNRLVLERDQALPIFDRESAIQFCRSLSDAYVEKIGLENIERVVKSFSTLGGMLLSKTAYQAHKSWQILESSVRSDTAYVGLCRAFWGIMPEPASFFDRCHPHDRQILSGLERDFAEPSTKGQSVVDVEAYKGLVSYRGPGDLPRMVASTMFLATSAIQDSLRSSDISLFLPLCAIPETTSSFADVPSKMVSALSNEARQVVARLACHPQFPAVCLTYANTGDIFQCLIESYAKVEQLLQGGDAKQFLDGELIRALVTQVFDCSAANVLSTVPIDLLAADPIDWGLRVSLLFESEGALMVRAALIDHLAAGAGTLAEKYADSLLRFSVLRYGVFEQKPVDEEFLVFYGPTVFHEQVIAPRPPVPLGIQSALSALVSQPDQHLLKRCVALFKDNIRLLLSAAEESKIPTADILFNDFLILCLCYPDQIVHALSAAQQLCNCVDQIQLPPERRFKLVATIAQLLSSAIHDACLQQKELFEAQFPSPDTFGSVHCTFAQMLSEIEACAPETCEEALYSLANRIILSSNWWDVFTVNLLSTGFYNEDMTHEVRAALQDFIMPYMVNCSDDMLSSWSCFKPGQSSYPTPSDLASTLKLLLQDVTSDADFTQFREYLEFSKVMKSPASSGWIDHISLESMCAIFKTYVTEFKHQGWRIAPLQHMMASFGQLPYIHNHALVDSIVDTVLTKGIAPAMQRFRSDIFSSDRPDVVPSTPIDVFLLCIILNVGHAEFTSSRPAHEIMLNFARASRRGSLRPLPSHWKPLPVIELPTIKTPSEVVLDADVLSAFGEVIGKLQSAMSLVNPLYGRLRAQPPASLNQDAEGRFLAQLLYNDRYFQKSKAVTRDSSHKDTREKLLRTVEFLFEGLSGGLKNNITCVADPEVRAEIKSKLHLDTLHRYIADEYQRYESAPFRKDKPLRVGFIPTRGVFTEFAGYICDTCLVEAADLVQRHPNLVFVYFTRQTANPDKTLSTSFAGGSLVVEITIKDEHGGERQALMIRGFNPSSQLLKKVKTSEIFNHFVAYLSQIASASGIDTIVVPQDDSWGIALSNRPFVFEHIKGHYMDRGAAMYTVADVHAATINNVPVHRVVSIWEAT